MAKEKKRKGKRTGTWSTQTNSNRKEVLYRNQGRLCIKCLKFFQMHELSMVLKPNETVWYELRCRGCVR